MISNKSKRQALAVMHMIYDNNITQIHTRGALDRMIEIVKFPEVANMKKFGGRSLTSGKVTAYKNQQYDVIRHWLINAGFLIKSHDGYRYHYKVVK